LNSLPPVNKAELDSKHLGELHALAADAGIERYRMLSKAELIEKLAGGRPGGEAKPAGRREEPRRRRRGGGDGRARQGGGGERQREPREGGPPRRRREQPPARPKEPAPEPESAAAEPGASERPKRRRRRRWGRRRKGVRVHDLLLPAAPGRQVVVHGEGREGCTALLRELAAELSGASDGADPIALLVDPSPEELAEWKREAPRVEIVAAGQARHAADAVAQAKLRAADGEDVVVLIDSLSRFAESFGDADEAKALFDAGRGAAGNGSLTVVAAVERS
jgi:transcription termination factor Rho